MSETTRRLRLPMIAANQAQKHVTHNEALFDIDAILHLHVEEKDALTPPAAPAPGARFLLGSAPTGAWAGHAGKVAAWEDGQWRFIAPARGWMASVGATAIVELFDGAAWRPAFEQGAQQFSSLGVNATPDATNPVAMKLNNVLAQARPAAEGGTGDVRLKLSKQATANTASVLFQNGFSGRAEFGLTGSDAFSLKVSANGTAWRDAMRIDQASGRVQFPFGVGGGGVRQIASTSSAAERTLRAADAGALIVLAGAADFTVTTEDMASLGNGWSLDLRCEGGVVVTLDPDGAATVDGQASITLARGQTCRLYCDGAGLRTVGLRHRVRLHGAALTAPAASVEFEVPPGFAAFDLTLATLSASGGNDAQVVQLSANGGATWITTGYSSTFLFASAAGSVTGGADTTAGLPVGYTSLVGAMRSSIRATLLLGPGAGDIRMDASGSYGSAATPSIITHASQYPTALAGVNRARLVRNSGGQFAAGTRVTLEGVR